MNNHLVSVIIPTFNSQETIDKCLRSIDDQSYKDIEILVVDNYSTDKTKEIALKFATFYTKGPERSNQRNFGASIAKGYFLFFVDSDMKLEQNVIDSCVKESISMNTQAIVVPEISIGTGFWAQCKALERSCYIKDSLIEAPRFFTKEAFRKVGGYDEDLTAAEDWDLSSRIKEAGFIFSRIESVIWHNEGKLSLKKTIMKKYAYGKNIIKYINKHKQEARKQFILFRPSFFKNYKNLCKNPIISAGMIFMKTCEFGAGFLGMISNKLGK